MGLNGKMTRMPPEFMFLNNYEEGFFTGYRGDAIICLTREPKLDVAWPPEM